MFALGLLLLVPATMWTTQSLTLVASGLPVQVRIDRLLPARHLRRNLRVAMHGSFLAIVVLYPLTRGQSPLNYYLSYFPVGNGPRELAWGAAATILYLAAAYLAWVATGVMQFGRYRDRMSLSRRLARALAGAVLLAFIEEIVFRSMLLADLLRSFEAHPWVAVMVGTVVFSAGHCVARVTRRGILFGQLAVGLLLSVAFVCTNALWLPMGLHAGGIWFARSLRPVTRSDAPPWLVGDRSFPFASVPGVVAALLLTLNVYQAYGR
jgi:membrane protease YdiL (CAAX protease family)